MFGNADKRDMVVISQAAKRLVDRFEVNSRESYRHFPHVSSPLRSYRIRHKCSHTGSMVDISVREIVAASSTAAAARTPTLGNKLRQTATTGQSTPGLPPKKPHVLRKPRLVSDLRHAFHASPLFPPIQISPQRKVLNFLNAHGYYHWNGVYFQKKFTALTGDDIFKMLTFIYGLVEPSYFGKAKGTPETIDLIVKLCKKLSTKEQLKETHLHTPLALHSSARVFRFMAELCAHVDAKFKLGNNSA